MSVDDRPTLLAIQHVPWETPHRILDACRSLAVHTVKPLAGQALSDHGEVAGAVVMGGPMGVDEVDRHPALALEREWLAEALRREMPLLGVCLGAQLLARALGAEVRPRERPELGFAPVEILDPATRSSAPSPPARPSCTGMGTSSTCPRTPAPSRAPPRPSTKPSATATPGALANRPTRKTARLKAARWT